jgi:hypothetical protein
MGPMFRQCEDCGGARLFEQSHEAPGGCPDALDGLCPEWFCTECGAAVLAVASPFPAEPAAEPAAVPGASSRVA